MDVRTQFGLPQKRVRKTGCNSLILRLFAFVCVCSCLRAFICVLGPFSEGLKICLCLRLRAFVCVRLRLQTPPFSTPPFVAP